MANNTVISAATRGRRAYWVSEIQKLSGNFGIDSSRLEQEIFAELKKDGTASLLDHLRLCGAIPELYDHDSSEEKLYSKYTDVLLAAAFAAVGIKSAVLRERGDSADVECVTSDYSFVADAKSFRLSRTAKNQKDFKVQAMDGWKRGKPFATVVCPMYQLPSRASQIYEQASARNVCIFTYSHLCVLIAYAKQSSDADAQALLKKVFLSVSALNPTKSAIAYWATINNVMISHSQLIPALWKTEKIASLEAINSAKDEAITFLAFEREKIMRMSHEEAIRELVKVHNIDGRIAVIKDVVDNQLMSVT